MWLLLVSARQWSSTGLGRETLGMPGLNMVANAILLAFVPSIGVTGMVGTWYIPPPSPCTRSLRLRRITRSSAPSLAQFSERGHDGEIG
ncbi:hypothetical protein BKA70DRAFT_1255849 [Coprinopsis sp. MPI-PUGE-AT-0042]|nr:hypothetical protein BKA70DRAFT_1255849 [Coprinopsis sp. MPI-PUGE-AT-0042]